MIFHTFFNNYKLRTKMLETSKSTYKLLKTPNFGQKPKITQFRRKMEFQKKVRRKNFKSAKN